MVIQFLGHRNDGCLDWFDTVTCTPTTPTCSTPTPTPPPDCPDGYNGGEPFILLRDNGGCTPQDLQNVEFAIQNLGYSNIFRIEEIPGTQYAWYVTCCGSYCGYVGFVSVCGVPYNVCACVK
jgi:hypothetical protein